MHKNYLEMQFNRVHLFQCEEVLEINYIPENIPYRDQELILLSKIFVKTIETPFKISRKVLIQGNVGIGKTLICQVFGQMLTNSSKLRNLNLKYVHVNCRKNRTSFQILYQILKKINCNIPRRGFSPQDFLSILQDFLKEHSLYMVLTLDELNFLDTSKFDLIYSLTRLNDSNFESKNYISIIGIVRDLTLLKNLDTSTISSLQGNIIKLKKYTKEQIFQILSDRINIAIKPGVFPIEYIEFISDQIQQSGDIRKGLNIIKNAVKIAESQGHNQVTLDDIKNSFSNLIPSLQDDGLDILNLHQIILLFSITSYLLDNNLDYLEIKDFIEIYHEFCSIYKLKPWKTTQMWENLQFLKKSGLIKISLVSKNVRGRKSRISINSLPLQVLYQELESKILKLSGRC